MRGEGGPNRLRQFASAFVSKSYAKSKKNSSETDPRAMRYALPKLGERVTNLKLDWGDRIDFGVGI